MRGDAWHQIELISQTKYDKETIKSDNINATFPNLEPAPLTSPPPNTQKKCLQEGRDLMYSYDNEKWIP